MASVYFLSDILPPLAQLSRAFQKTNIDFSMVKPLVQGTKDCISDLQASHGEMFSTLFSDRLSCKILNALMTISIEGPEHDEFPFERTCSIWSG